MKSLELFSFKFVFCDSKKAILWAKKKGLKNNATILTSSPSLLEDKKLKTYSLDRLWSVKKMEVFRNKISVHSNMVFNFLISKKILKKEEALLVAGAVTDYHKTIYKAACLKNIKIDYKYLFLKIIGDYGRKKPKLNPPWEELFKYNQNLEVFNFKLTKLETSKSSKRHNFLLFLKRIYIGGIESIFYRLMLKLSFMWTKNKKFFILGENELLIETSFFLGLKGYKPIYLDTSNRSLGIKKYNNRTLKKKLMPLIKIITQKYVSNDFLKASLDIFFKDLNIRFEEFYKNKYCTNKYLKKLKILSKNVLLTPNHINPKNLGILSAFKKNNIPIISFQHGVTPEITSVSDAISSTHPANNVDVFIAFNENSTKVAEQQTYIKSKSFISGLPKRYFRTNKRFNLRVKNKKDVLFLSGVLYRGNVSSFNGNLSDINRYYKEKYLIKNILTKIPHKVYYKPYLLENLRYLDTDPAIKLIKKSETISLIEEKVDARYILSDYKVLIVQGASSTLSWLIFSKKPIIFINDKDQCPVNKEVTKLLKTSLFYFDSDNKNFQQDILTILSKPINEIKNLYKKKEKNREKLIKLFFSTYSMHSGKRAANFIENNYFNK